MKKWMLLALLAGIWGSSFILMKRGMFTLTEEPIFSSSQVGALRMLIASLVMLPFAIKFLLQLKKWENVKFLMVVGFCGNFIPAFLFTYAETGISSGYAGMLNSCTPIFTIIIGYLVFSNKLTFKQLLGVFIGTIGLVFLMLSGQDLSITGNYTHVLSIVLATLFYGISINTIKHKLSHLKALEISALSFTLLFIPGLLAFFAFGVHHTIQSNENALEGLGYISILSVVGTALALVIYNRIIALSNPLFASSVTYFIPIVAVWIGLGFEEQIHINQILSMLVVLFGVFFANYRWAK